MLRGLRTVAAEVGCPRRRWSDATKQFSAPAGFAYHENNPTQLARDALKNEILQARGLRLLRLPTTGSDEEERIRKALDEVEKSAMTGPAV